MSGGRTAGVGLLVALAVALVACSPRSETSSPAGAGAPASEIERAFVAVYGARPPLTLPGNDACGGTVHAPHSLVAAGDQFVLTVLAPRDGDRGRSCQGTGAIYYLRRAGETYTVVRRWPDALMGNDWGKAANVRVRFDLFSNPALEMERGTSTQGFTTHEIALLELTPQRPAQRLGFISSYRNSGPFPGMKPCSFETRLSAVDRDGALWVAYLWWPGGRREYVTLVRDGETYRPEEAGKALPETC